MQSSILFVMAICALALVVLTAETRWMWVWIATAWLNFALAYALMGK